MSQIEAAIAAIESLEPGEQFSYRQLAIEFACSRTTLARRHQGLASSRSTMAENQQALHPQQEQELLRYIRTLTERGLPPTGAMIQRFGSDISKKELGKNWVDWYIQRHKVDLISR
jgi:DNA-binding transcriptional regulator YhcF (GntR family)